ncbi:toxin-antitoxin system YwqK family antitoxin [Pseudotamlana carrageenivorans]|nr:toxin-antitoxin system YwqK family antitoxin [Tamlana carrageenivorans]
MKKIFSVCFVFFVSSFMWSQDINQFDANGKRHGIWKKNFDNTNIVRYEGAFNHGKETGLFKFYTNYKNKAILSATKLFDEKTGIADVKFLTSNGKVISEGQMNGKAHIGTWKYYQKHSDKILTLETYDSTGELVGERLVYFPNGKVAERKNYVNGKLEGKAYSYTEKGVVLSESHYENGEFHGPYKSYDTKGQLVSEGVFKRGKKEGIWKFYRNGKLTDEKNFSYVPKRTKKTP